MIGNTLSALDGALAFLPAGVRLALYAAVAGAGAMLLYELLSPQERLARLQRALTDARSRMRAYDGDDLREVGGLIRESVGLSLRQIGIVFLPTVLAAAPVLLTVAWLEEAYSHRLPEPGTPVVVEYHTTMGTLSAPGSPIPWPSAAAPVTLHGPSGSALVRLPLGHPRDRITRRSWWHGFFPNPAGYLPPDARVAAVALGLPAREFLPFGPGWLRSWQTPFLLVLSLAAVAVKVGRGIR